MNKVQITNMTLAATVIGIGREMQGLQSQAILGFAQGPLFASFCASPTAKLWSAAALATVGTIIVISHPQDAASYNWGLGAIGGAVYETTNALSQLIGRAPPSVDKQSTL